MCHHDDPVSEEWLRELDRKTAEEDDDTPEFANESSDVDVELLEADDD